MSEQDMAYEIWAAKEAQKGEPTVGDMKRELLQDEGRVGLDIRAGLEVASNNAPVPPPTEQIDPGFAEFVQRHEDAPTSESEAWSYAAAATEEATLQSALREVELGAEYEDVLQAALRCAAVGEGVYEQFLAEIPEFDGYRARLAQDVTASLAQAAEDTRNAEFAEEMQASEQVNTEVAKAALIAVAEFREMDGDQLEHLADQFLADTGVPLRTALLSVPPDDRGEFLNEVAVAAEAAERGARMQRFAASLFAPDTDISSGLVVRGQRAGGDLPPVLLDGAYAASRAERAIRAEDRERVEAPKSSSVREIKEQLLESDERDWRSGLTRASNGRPLSMAEVYEADPDSISNQNKRERQRAAMRLQSRTGGRFT